MVETFARFWPSDIDLLLFTEGFTAPAAPNVYGLEFPRWFVDWKARHEAVPDAHGRDPKRNRKRKSAYDFRRDCVKFAHKVAAITAGARARDCDIMVWMDADTLTHVPVDERWLRGLLFKRSDSYLAWLDRRRLYPECGFLLFNCRHSAHVRFMTRLQDLYNSRRVFDLPETHDSYVIQWLVLQCVAEGWMPEPIGLSGPAAASHHPFPLSELGSRLDHAKGPRKSYGRTPRFEVGGKRSEPHWR
jgi:hypothetical protein